eukprot:NODE_4913_length_629_cov_265.069686.p1 GENE.NODE_4913_length_629_cov_265.069686~~NODE_4913_length_629_cov_265.069686.p1  ORF type:complete len:154 (-),score=20.55 NODE_4913_length_629_cov_265.069686:150-611(-)
MGTTAGEAPAHRLAVSGIFDTTPASSCCREGGSDDEERAQGGGRRATPAATLCSVDDLIVLEAGQLCIQDGRCMLCRRECPAGRWGNPRCRGCSIVDKLPFERHPFSALLLHRFGDEPLQAESPRLHRRCATLMHTVGAVQQLARRTNRAPSC